MSVAGEIACFGGWVLTLPFFRASELSPLEGNVGSPTPFARLRVC